MKPKKSLKNLLIKPKLFNDLMLSSLTKNKNKRKKVHCGGKSFNPIVEKHWYK
jgi:hypothetical protein